MSEWEPQSEIVHTTKRWKWVLYFLLGAALTAAFVWMSLTPEAWQPDGTSTTRRGRQGDALMSLLGDNAVYFWWAVTVFMGLGTILFFISIFKPPSLVLDKSGFKIDSFFKRKFYSWNETSQFTLRRMRTSGVKYSTIHFFMDENGKAKKQHLATNYGLKPEEQLELLNQYRERALETIPLSEETTEQIIPQNMQPNTENEWQPPSDHEIREERAPWFRWAVSGALVGSIVLGAFWLMSKVIIPSDVPNKPVIDLPVAETPDETKPTRTADDEAWVRALEKDTLEGYREYLELFPDGKHKDEAQAEIDAYDNKAWSIAEQRQTLAGYEDYLEAWPEGLHESKAREKIAEIKARAEAIRKDAAERAAQDAVDWDAAALANTIDSYGGYLAKQPRGQWVAEAQNRINQIKADQASAAASAADRQAWDAARAANRADSYQQYISSYPQGVYVPQAIAAIEQLKPAPGRTFKDCDVCPLMVSLPSGNANLGAADGEDGARPNEKPQRPVNFSNLFAMGVHEVTFSEWNACVSSGGCNKRPNDNGWGGAKRPVINVSWDDAQSYTSWLSSKTGFTYSLPSEAQWEYGARGGDTGTHQGGSLTALCAFANGAGQESGLKWGNSACTDPSSDRTLPVGLLSANKFGLKDMIGNVAEWTLDCNTLNLRDAPSDGRADQRGSCNQRSVRGGSWFSGPADLRYAARLMQRRGDSNDFTGFRVIRQIEN